MELSTVRDRDRLKAKREPYWHKLDKRQFIGYRPSKVGGAGSWIARWYDSEIWRNRYCALGDFGDLAPSDRYGAAKGKARQWLDHVSGGGSTGKPVTVKQACERYAATRPEAAARFQRHVYPEPIAKVKLAKLVARHVQAWRENLAATPAPITRRKHGNVTTRPRSPSSLNRDMTAMRAALNQAFQEGDILNNQAWRIALKPVKNADMSRDVYLDRQQRRDLLGALPPEAAAFVAGLCALPLRPGALAALVVNDFDVRTGTLKIGKDKSGKDRCILLPRATIAMLKDRARSKLPAAPLFMRADGKAWDRYTWRGPIKDAVRAARLPDSITAYALRHSTITDLIADGVPTLTVAQLAGTGVAMIEKHYGHLLQGQAAAALEKLVL